jgi:predicted NBD/HSP70 family sugar kinase
VLYGHGREVRDFLVLTIGRGVGLSIVTDGTVYRGGSGGAGEIGHFPIEADGPECGCGRRGCLEARIGEDGLVRWARERGVLGPRQSFRALVAAADAGRPDALDLFADAGRLLGQAVAGVANVLDPERIVVLGEGTAHWIHWDGGFRAEFDARRLHRPEPTGVIVDSWDDRSWAQGAAALVLAAPFDVDGSGGTQAELVVARLHGEQVG